MIYSGTSHNATDKSHAPNWLCHRNNTFLTSKRRTTSYLRTMDKTCAPKGQVAVQNSLKSRQRSKSRMKIVKNSLKFSYSALPRKYIILSPVHVCLFWVSARDRWLRFMQTTPLNVTLQPHNWGVWLASNLRDRDNLSTEDNSPAPNVSIIQRFHCRCYIKFLYT